MPAHAPPTAATRQRLPATATRPLGVVLIALIAMALIFGGVRMTSAGIADFQAQAFLADWETKSAQPSQRAWDVAHQAARRAIAHYPVANGAYLERLGYIHAWQHFSQPFGSTDAQPSRQAARDAQRAAVQARPTWPYAWAALAEAKLNLLEFDDEFHQALANALRYGPYRADIQRRVAAVGFIAWPQLSPHQQTTTLDVAANAITQARRHRAPLFALATAAGQHTRLCNDLLKQGHRPSAQHCPLPAQPQADQKQN